MMRVGRKRTNAENQVADLLHTARTSLGLSTAFLSRLDGTTQHLEVVDSAVPLLFPEKVTQRQSTSLCQGVLDGELPAVMPDLTAVPAAMRRPAAWLPRVRSFISVPVTLSDGTLYGTFCAAGLSTDEQLTDRDQALLKVLAHAAALVIEPELSEQAQRSAVTAKLAPVIAAGGPEIALQPIVDLATGRRVGAEALARFPGAWQQPPDVVFADAHRVDLGDELELLALRRAAEALGAVTGYVAMNVSPATLLLARVRRFLRRAPLQRIVLELSEHDPVADYEELLAALAALRAAGMRLAIDDVGAGFSSLRHIVLTSPDVLKLDRTIVAGVGDDSVLTTLVRSMVDFARGCGATVVAEGIETADDARRLRSLGVQHGQGWFFAPAGHGAALRECYEMPARTTVPRPRSPASAAVMR